MKKTNTYGQANRHQKNCISCIRCWKFMNKVPCNKCAKDDSRDKDKQYSDNQRPRIWPKYQPPIEEEFL